MSPRVDFPDTKMFITKNPMTAVYGLTPDRKCGACSHLIGDRYFKCDLRRITHGPATDHRKSWPACGRFEGD